MFLVPAVLVPAVALASVADPEGFRQEATFVVPTGASEEGPGNAYEANQLAVTYASLLPRDAELLQRVSTMTSVPVSKLKTGMQSRTLGETSILVLSYEGPTQAEVEDVIAAAVASLTSAGGASPAIGSGSLVLTETSPPTAEGSALKSILPLGVMLGLALGTASAVALERAVPRIDSPGHISRALSIPVCSLEDVESEFGVAMLSRWETLSPGLNAVTLVAVRPGQLGVMEEVAKAVAAASSRRGRPTIVISWPSRARSIMGTHEASDSRREPHPSAEESIHSSSLRSGAEGAFPEPGTVRTFRVLVAGSTASGEGGTAMAVGSGFVVLVVPAASKVVDLISTYETLEQFGVPPVWAIFTRRTPSTNDIRAAGEAARLRDEAQRQRQATAKAARQSEMVAAQAREKANRRQEEQRALQEAASNANDIRAAGEEEAARLRDDAQRQLRAGRQAIAQAAHQSEIAAAQAAESAKRRQEAQRGLQ